MKTIQIRDKQFELSIPEAEIQAAVRRVGDAINRDLADTDPLFICVLNGAFMFAADLMKIVNFPCEITFVKLSSYEGIYTTGSVKEVIGLNESVVGRNVVVVEDIVDTGNTLVELHRILKEKKVKSLKVATLLFKPDAYKKDLKVDLVGISIPDKFVVGYGLDFDGLGRNLPDIYQIKH